MLLDTAPITQLGVAESRASLRFGEGAKPAGSWAGRRLMWIDGSDQPAFELTYWCGTCPFLFRRLDGAIRTFSVEALTEKLSVGLDRVDPSVVDVFAELLPEGPYLPMLLRVSPTLVQPGDERDYFSHEQVATWGPGTAEDPRGPYYRTFTTPVDDTTHLYEFVVPMVPPSWNDQNRASAYGQALGASSRPTAVAVSTLDICQPAVVRGDVRDDHAHWALTHFLLDGHHKLQAAAATGRQLQLLTLVAVGAGLAGRQAVDRLPDLRRQDNIGRPHIAR